MTHEWTVPMDTSDETSDDGTIDVRVLAHTKGIEIHFYDDEEIVLEVDYTIAEARAHRDRLTQAIIHAEIMAEHEAASKEKP